MNHMLKKCLSITALLSVAAVSAGCGSACSGSSSGSSGSGSGSTSVAPRLTFRSQGRDKVMQIAGTERLTNLPDMESWYGLFSITPEYTQSFKPNRIANCLFGSDLVNTNTVVSSTCGTTSNGCGSSTSGCGNSGRTIQVQGSSVANRAANAWLADYFYLPVDFNGSFSVKPRIRNVNVNFDLYLGLDEWCNNLYFRIYGPVTNTRWKLGFCEDIVQTATTGYGQGYFTPTAALPASNLLQSFASYARGDAPAAVQGVTFQGLNFARITSGQESKTGFADLRAELGWNFWNCEDYRIGINIQAAAPTGNKVSACNLFSPQIGNHMWELGGGLNAYYRLWSCDDESLAFDFNLDVNITHMFKAKETRTFDLKGKPNSRYMLAEQLAGNTQNLTGATTGAASNKQFSGVFAPVANITTQDVKVSIGAQADLVAWFTMNWCNFIWDIGYNFWGRSCEKIHASDNCNNTVLTSNSWALKGVAQVYGYASAASGTIPTLTTGQAVALAATQNSATIHNGIRPNTANIAVDDAQPALAGGTPVALNTAPTGVAVAINTSIQPVAIATSDIDFNGSRTRGISNKVFSYLGYNWEGECWSPFVGVGAFGEFGQGKSNSCSNNTTSNTTVVSAANCKKGSCHKCALSQWGVFVKLGVAFN